MEFEIPYWISNNGDGSASVNFCQKLSQAEQADEEQSEGFGESTASSLKIKVVKGKLYFEDFDYVDGKYQYIWKEVTG